MKALEAAKAVKKQSDAALLIVHAHVAAIDSRLTDLQVQCRSRNKRTCVTDLCVVLLHMHDGGLDAMGVTALVSARHE